MTIEERIKQVEGRIAYAYEGESETVRLQDETFLLSELKRCREALEKINEYCNDPSCGSWSNHALHPEGVK